VADSNSTYAGKAKYDRYLFIIKLLVILFAIFPKRFCLFLWSFSDLFYGHFGCLIRYCVMKKMAKKCGDRIYIGRGVEIRNWENLEIGDHVSIHQSCYLEAAGSISIGNEVSIAHQTSLISSDHGWSDPNFPIRDNPVITRPILIKDDVWIGCGCRILSGVTINSRSIVAAGAVVNKDVPEHFIVGGVPAKKIRQI
jgi:acetyltransferase-like isoleucine patch superfamily enzyme